MRFVYRRSTAWMAINLAGMAAFLRLALLLVVQDRQSSPENNYSQSASPHRHANL
ncbi:hypothetical protein FHW58_000753 [Duganella sp. 1224]|uniref:hypothetical protein n=1 Tax=Duganella sp. 1224 TaxID=2587052 RepID=UPI0015CE4F3E|nr:hypothetical protein [Duganella sp. 1224]NYE59601.1 hypothetical protein [Duganella sp. 1224]